MNIDRVINRGERVVVREDADFDFTLEGMIYYRHLFAYHQVLPHCLGRQVLEVGCGSGYGAALMSRFATRVMAVDVDPQAIWWARQHHQASNLTFEVLHADQPAPPSQPFDVVVSFQVIEHIKEPALHEYLTLIGRALAPGGHAFFTTPNRLRRLRWRQKPFNPHHRLEYSAVGLGALLRRYFHDVTIEEIVGNPRVESAEAFRVKTITPVSFLGGDLIWDSIRSRLRRGAVKIGLSRILGSRFRTPAAPQGGPVTKRRWRSDTPFTVADFHLIKHRNWYSLDLFARVSNPIARGSS